MTDPGPACGRPDELMTTEEVAEHFGIQPQSVRRVVSDAGVRQVRGYWRSDIEAIPRPGQGHRTDLTDGNAGRPA